MINPALFYNNAERIDSYFNYNILTEKESVKNMMNGIKQTSNFPDVKYDVM